MIPFLSGCWNVYVTIIHFILQAFGFSETAINLSIIGITAFFVLAIVSSGDESFSHRSSRHTTSTAPFHQSRPSFHTKHMREAAEESRKSVHNTAMHANQQAHRAAMHTSQQGHKTAMHTSQQTHKTHKAHSLMAHNNAMSHAHRVHNNAMSHASSHTRHHH
jgi:hypothetical protein